MKKLSVLLFISVVTLKFASSQIEIRSQYYFNEPLLNPAMTGLFERMWKAKNTHRIQFEDNLTRNGNMFSAEYKKVFNKKAGDYGLVITEFTGYMLGIGYMNNLYTNSFDNTRFQTNHISLALHKQLKNKSFISLGVQPGYLRSNTVRKFDLNAGIMYGNSTITCWQEDMYFKTQIGISVYNILSDFSSKDSNDIFGKKVQVHAGQLIKARKHFNFFANTAFWYDNSLHYSFGVTSLFFPIVHYNYFDRGRLGLHYRSSNHLVFSAGCRFYGGGQKTLSLDGIISVDIPMKFIDLNPTYKTGFEIGILITPLQKCWSMSKC